jgi:hypothetical protein
MDAWIMNFIQNILSKILDFKSLSVSKKKTLYILSCAFIILLAASFIVGISDNLPGILLVFASFSVLFTGFVINWNTVRQFIHLIMAALISFVLFVMLHNAFYAAGEYFDIVVLDYIFNALSVVSFIIAVLACPPAFVVGVIGSIVMFFRKRPG